MDKENVAYPHNGIALSHEKERSADATAGMNLQNIMLNEISQT